MSDEYIPLYQRVSTGQIRRRPTEQHIQQYVGLILEHKKDVISVMCLDIDGFSSIERQYGFEMADALLDAITAYMEDQNDPAIDLFARYVRDSFLVVYEELTLEEAFLEGEQLRSRLSQTTFTVNNGSHSTKIKVTFSGGVATYPGDPEDHHELIGLAEEATRRAMANGGSRLMLGRAVNMTPKTSHYSPVQLDRLRELRNLLDRSEASLLREALDDLLRKYDQRDQRRGITVSEDVNR